MSHKVNFVNIPKELKNNASFCVWRSEKRQGRMTKVPYNPITGRPAKTNEPETFVDFPEAMKTYAFGGWDGIGYRVSEGIGAIDIDHCIQEDGTLNDVAASILSFLPDAYFEKSPSGTGLRGFFELSEEFAYDKTLYYINNRKHGLEVYLPGITNRFVTVTGDVYRSGSITRNDEALQSILDTFMRRNAGGKGSAAKPMSYLSDQAVIEHAGRSETGNKFKALMDGKWEGAYASQSDADMALVSMLAFWCGNEEAQIDRIFRTSGLYREKWDRKTGDSTYGQVTIKNVVASSNTIYLPIQEKEFADDDFNDEDANKDPTFEFYPDISRVTLTMEEMRPHTNPRYQRGEIGLGNLFADYFKPIARFDAKRNIWYVYDGKVWRSDENNLAVSELAKIIADRLYLFALNIKDEDARSRYIKRMQKLQVRKNRRTMIEDAKSVYAVPHSIFDQNTDLFNCRNGTLNLATGEFLPHDPADFLTYLSGVTYDPKAECPRWIRFIDEVMCGDKDLANYLQKSLGYTLTGDTSRECLFILYGATSRNGKGTTMETFLKVMGDYGKTSNPEMIASKFGVTNTSAPSEEVARLAGVRFVNVSEPDKSIAFSAGLVKRLTGNDTINARFLHENSFDFLPTFKIFINTNYKPAVSDMLLFDSNRLKLIPFNRHFEEHEQDRNLKSFFSRPENLSAIFNWCYEGYKKLQKEELQAPEAVRQAIKEYEEESDRIRQFVDAWLEEGESFEVRSSAVYRLYGEWCEKYGYRKENNAHFNHSIKRFFRIERKRPEDGSGSTTSMLIGCRFLKQENGDSDEDRAAFS